KDAPKPLLSPPRRKVKELPFSSARQVNASYLGKATEDVKLLLPGTLKSMLVSLAEQAGQPLSDYLRSVLARQLLGERFFHEWQDALEEINRRARIAERDDSD